MEMKGQILPANWRWVRLGEICELAYGKSLPTHVRMTGEVPVYGSNGIVGWHSQAVTNGPAVVIGRKGSIGEVHYSSVPCWPIDTTYYVDQSKVECDLVWLAFWLRALKLIELNKAAAVPGLNRDDAYALKLPLPPLPEQQRIAAILHEQLAAMERARAATEAQLEAANALPAIYLREVFDGSEAKQWPRTRLGEVIRQRQEIVHPYDRPNGRATFVGLEHIESATGHRIGSLDVEMSELSGRKPRFYKDNVVYGYLRPYLNKVWVAEFDGLCSVDQYVYVVDPKEADTFFIASFMRSPVYLERAPVGVTPGYLPRIRTEEVASVELNLPPLPEQQRIVAKLSEQMASAERLRRTLAEQLDAVNRLPAALLRRAFRGEL